MNPEYMREYLLKLDSIVAYKRYHDISVWDSIMVIGCMHTRVEKQFVSVQDNRKTAIDGLLSSVNNCSLCIIYLTYTYTIIMRIGNQLFLLCNKVPSPGVEMRG